MLSLEEYLSSFGEAVRATASRDFKVFDSDRDEKLSQDEVLSIPSQTPLVKRKASADPVVTLADAQIQRISQLVSAADTNQNGMLDGDEFKSSGWSRNVAGLELTVFTDWDCDKDGAISAADISRFLEAAYGVNRLDGVPYRENSPSVSFTSCVVLKSSGWLTSTSVGLMPMGMAS